MLKTRQLMNSNNRLKNWYQKYKKRENRSHNLVYNINN